MPGTNQTIAARLDGIPRKTLKAALAPPDVALQEVKGIGQLVADALEMAQISQKEAAITMGISESLLARQLREKEHLSLKRLWDLPDRFWREMIVLLAQRKGVARVRQQLVMVGR